MKIQYIYIALLFFITHSVSGQLNPDRHTTSPTDAWKSCAEAMNPNGESGMSHWIKFDFDGIYNLTDVQIWNLNDPANLTEGVQSLRIDYSINNSTWTNAGTFTVNQSDGSAFYEGEIVTNLNGIPARYIILTAEDNYGGVCSGISEARFYTGLAVPVELASFEAVCNEGKKSLSWSFADVSDFESVDVEWSKNGIDWERIFTSRSPGIEESSGMFSNEWTDKRKSTSNKNFYRLKMNDDKGTSQFSDVVIVSCILSEQDVTIYPQPVSSEMTINIDLVEDSSVKYSILDILGKKVESGEWDVNSGLNQYKIDASNLIPGPYFIEFNISGEIIQKKFVKQ